MKSATARWPVGRSLMKPQNLKTLLSALTEDSAFMRYDEFLDYPACSCLAPNASGSSRIWFRPMR